MSTTVWVALITAVSTGTVAIGGQIISSHVTLSTKKLEILFVRKADAYKNILEKAGEFGIDPKSSEKYLAFQSALHAALIVASKEVADILDDNPRMSLHMNANRLRMADNQDEIARYQMHEWREALESTKTAMREDVAKVSEVRLPRLRDIWRGGMKPIVTQTSGAPKSEMLLLIAVFFTFPEDARWNPDREAVEFSVTLEPYEGTVTVSRRAFERLLDQSPTPERCVGAFHQQPTRFELVVERKLPRRRLTEDGTVEITGRDLREKIAAAGQCDLFSQAGSRI
jgi:hypothetical protein